MEPVSGTVVDDDHIAPRGGEFGSHSGPNLVAIESEQWHAPASQGCVGRRSKVKAARAECEVAEDAANGRFALLQMGSWRG